MEPTTDAKLNTFINAFTDLIAAKVSERLTATDHESPKIKKRLFTVEEAAVYLGRTKEGVQHMIAAAKLTTVKLDRRVFLDRKDLDAMIERSKIQ